MLLFVDEKFNISSLKKLISVSEYSYIQDLLKNESLEKKIITFDISSKRKIILISLKNDSTESDAENLVAKCYDLFKIKKQLSLSHLQFINLCILFGCDYLKRIKGLGTVSSYKYIKQNQDKNIEEILEMIKKSKNLEIPENYIEEFNNAK